MTTISDMAYSKAKAYVYRCISIEEQLKTDLRFSYVFVEVTTVMSLQTKHHLQSKSNARGTLVEER